MVNDHTRSAENWKCVWHLLRLDIYIRVYVDSHSLGQLALASKRTGSARKTLIVLALGHILGMITTMLSITSKHSSGVERGYAALR